MNCPDPFATLSPIAAAAFRATDRRMRLERDLAVAMAEEGIAEAWRMELAAMVELARRRERRAVEAWEVG